MSTAAAAPLILGLTGPSSAGKDSAAAYLDDVYGFAVIALADPILDMLTALAHHVDVDGAWCTEPGLKEQPMPALGRSYRELARSLGTAWGRELLGADWWVRIADHKLRQALERGDNVLVSDVRHHNELSWLAGRGGLLVRVHRPGRGFRAAEHDSESQAAELPAWREIHNTSTRAHLYDQLDIVVEQARRFHREDTAA